jgi:transcriptional regulator with XRE-family HTH domain
MDDIYKRLAHAREQAGLSQSQAARLAGTHKGIINSIEKGCHQPSEELFVDLCRVYDVSQEWVQTGQRTGFDRQAILDKARQSGASFEDANKIVDLLESLRQEGE